MAHPLNPIWQRVRRLTPHAWRTVNGYRVLDPEHHVADLLIPRARKYFTGDGHEEEAVKSLETHVREGDVVHVVGGGIGLTAVVALQQGAGHVRVYEPAKHRVEGIGKGLRHYDASGTRWSVHHAYVGELTHPWGEAKEAVQAPANDVFACDVLEMDAEGGEVDFLKALKDPEKQPRVIIMESHGFMGSSSSFLKGELEKLGYDVEILGVPVNEKDIRTLLAVRPDA